MGRRRFIISLSCIVTAGSGCLSPRSDNTTDIFISNKYNKTLTIGIQVRSKSTDEQLLDKTFKIASNSVKRYEEVVSEEEVIVNINIENGPEKTHEWYDGEQDSGSLFVDVSSESISFTEAAD